jgi:hypothetical protein
MKTFFTISMFLAFVLIVANVFTSEANASEVVANSAITLNLHDSASDPDGIDEIVFDADVETTHEYVLNSSQSAAIFQKVYGAVKGLPPTGVVATDNGNGTVSVNWVAPGDLTGFLHYNVYRSEQSGFVPNAANRIAENLNDTTYSDATVADFRT